ncbi:MAG: RNA polymerase sigma factor [Planctomycetota bacterium]|jgi:RNA polymerase sigma-70 factor (ECF subfamily)
MEVDLEACVNGSKQAWDAFVERYAAVILSAVRRTVSARVGDSGGHDVEEAAQEVFLRLIKNDSRLLRSFDPQRASLVTWLTLVSRSVAIDYLRKKRPVAALASFEGPTVDPISDERPSLPLNLLTPRQRLVLRLLFDQRLTVADAARAVGVDEQTIRSTKHKALSRLRSHLAPEC